jgi:glutamate formiminotransferase
MKLEFSRQNFEESLISNFIKIRPAGVEFLRADSGYRIIIDRYLLSAIGFTPGGSVKVQYIQIHVHNKKTEQVTMNSTIKQKNTVTQRIVP